MMANKDTPVMILQGGIINWLPSFIMTSSCKLDLKDFPFDKQQCLLAFGSWTHHVGELNLSATTQVYSQTPKSLDWKFENYECHVDVTNIFVQYIYPQLHCTLYLKRKPNFYLINVVLPCMLLLIIGSLAFCMPPESEERVSLSVTVFLALTVFLMSVMDIVPSSAEEVPLLGRLIVI